MEIYETSNTVGGNVNCYTCIYISLHPLQGNVCTCVTGYMHIKVHALLFIIAKAEKPVVYQYKMV